MNNLFKNGLLILAIGFAFTACKKDHTCTCTYTDTLGGEVTDTRTLENQTRADAVENCENFEEDYGFATINCNL